MNESIPSVTMEETYSDIRETVCFLKEAALFYRVTILILIQIIRKRGKASGRRERFYYRELPLQTSDGKNDPKCGV